MDKMLNGELKKVSGGNNWEDEDQKIVCPICDENFKTLDDLAHHMEMVHHIGAFGE